MFTGKDANDFMAIARQERKDAQVNDIRAYLNSEKFEALVKSAIRAKKTEVKLFVAKGLDRQFIIEELVDNGYFINEDCGNKREDEIIVTWYEPDSYMDF
jgi:hypothetical protein